MGRQRRSVRRFGAVLFAVTALAACSGSEAAPTTSGDSIAPTEPASTEPASTEQASTDSTPVAPTTTEASPTTVVPARPVLVSGPVTGGAGQANAALIDLAAAKYSESEYFVEGTATAYEFDGEPSSDGRWDVATTGEAPYRTRIIVRAPSAADFSGVVIVEWLNVTAGFDGDPDWGYTHPEMLREGHAWVGVSAQQVGVSGGDALLGEQSGAGLAGGDPARYGSLVHPGDEYSFDIFTQAADSLLDPTGASPLGDLVTTHLIAVGESQSAYFMTTYVNAVQPVSDRFDGFLVHSRGATAAALDGSSITSSDGGAGPVAIRDDLDVPVMIFETETDLTVLGYAAARQDDSATVRVWEVAGTAHADEHLLVNAYGLTPGPELAAVLGCTAPLNAGPQFEVLQAALHHLVGWVSDGIAPPTAPRLELASNDPAVIARDEFGLAIGGIRTPLVDVPVATLSGDLVEDGPGFCALFGSTVPFDEATLTRLYATSSDYLASFEASLQSTIDAGFVLAADADHLRATAQAWVERLGLGG